VTMLGVGQIEAEVVLSSSVLQVTVLPAKGADLLSVVDLATGVDVLFKTPWQPSHPGGAAWDSQSRWLAQYRGGWQVLCPNAGPARLVDGAVRGFHGEAAIVPWEVLERTPASVTCAVTLFTGPFRLERTVRVEGRTVVVYERVENLAQEPHELIWVHHPGFGAPLLGADARLDLPGGTLVADATAPGTVLAPASRHGWPHATDVDGGPLDLRVIPGEGEPRELFGCLVGLPEGWLALTNEALGVGVALHWDLDVFPYAWIWQELHATPGFPWFRRAYVMGVEPANVTAWTGDPAAPGPSKGPMLAGRASMATELEMSIFRPRGRVRAVGAGGVIEQEDGDQQ
jgi:Domain of unknown function (DUF4432)